MSIDLTSYEQAMRRLMSDEANQQTRTGYDDVSPMHTEGSDGPAQRSMLASDAESRLPPPPVAAPERWSAEDAAAAFGGDRSMQPLGPGGSSQGPVPWSQVDKTGLFPSNSSHVSKDSLSSGGLGRAIRRDTVGFSRDRNPVDFARDREYGSPVPGGKMVQTGDNDYEIVDDPVDKPEKGYGFKTPHGTVVETGERQYEIADNPDDKVATNADQRKWKDLSGPVKVVQNANWKDESGPVKIVTKGDWTDAGGSVKIVSQKPAPQTKPAVAAISKKLSEADKNKVLASAIAAAVELDKLGAGVRGMRNDVPNKAAGTAMAATRGSVGAPADPGDIFKSPSELDDEWSKAIANSKKRSHQDHDPYALMNAHDRVRGR